MEAKQHDQDSLRRFFGGEKVDSFKKNLAEFLTSDDYSGIRQEAGKQLRSMKWPGAAGKIAEHADLLLDTPLTPIFKRVYLQTNILHRYLDRDNYDPEEIVLAELANHEVKSTYSPKLDIVINEQPVGSLTFDIELALVLKGLVLKIQDAKIIGIIPGSCHGRGTISFYGHALVQKESESVDLPALDFKEGIPIAPRGQQSPQTERPPQAEEPAQAEETAQPEQSTRTEPRGR